MHNFFEIFLNEVNHLFFILAIILGLFIFKYFKKILTAV